MKLATVSNRKYRMPGLIKFLPAERRACVCDVKVPFKSNSKMARVSAGLLMSKGISGGGSH